MQKSEDIFTLPPNSIEAEKSVLGAMLQDFNSVLLALESLNKDDFYSKEHQMIFKAISQLQHSGSPIDIRTLSEQLKKSSVLDTVGGEFFLLSLIEFVPTTVNIKSYINIVKEKSTLRRLIFACRDINKLCYAQEESLDSILLDAEKKIYDIVMKTNSDSNLKSISEIMTSTFEYIENLANLKGKLSGIPTGFHELDAMLTGMHGGEFILVGARPSMGKTSVAISMARYASVAAKAKTAIFSLEMPCEQIATRMLCDDASIDMQKVRTGTLSDIEWEKLADSINSISTSPIFMDDSSGISTSQLRSRCRKLQMEEGLDLIVIDYLQLLRSDKKTDNRQNEVSEISRQLKSLAMELKVPLIACSQLSRRTTKKGEGKEPVLSDLRESGAIEQDADIVIFVHRDNYYKNNGEDTEEEERENIDDTVGKLIVAKQRNGPIGSVEVEWQGEFARYANKPNVKVLEFIKGE